MRAAKTIDIDDESWRSTLGSVLRQARMRAGLSLRQCAGRLDISPQTILEAEGGSDVRSSTMRRYLEALPGLTPSKMLGLPPGKIPVATPTAWQTYRDLCGFVARKARVTTRVLASGAVRRTVTVVGLRSLHVPMSDPTVRAALCRMACVGSPKGLSKLGAWPSGTRNRLRDENGVHAWRIPRELHLGLDYTFTQTLPSHADAAWDGGIPVDELQIRIVGEDLAPECAALRCRPSTTADDADLDAAYDLYPAGIPVERKAGGLAVRILQPAPLVEHALIVRAAGVTRPPKHSNLATSLRFRRRELGLGLKLAARRMGCSHVGLRAIELGSDTRASLVRRAVVGLDVPVDETLPPGLVHDSADLHEWLRDLYGIEAAALVKTLVIDADGMTDCTIETRGLRALRAQDADVRLRLGLARAALQRQPGILAEIEADVSDVRVRAVTRDSGDVQHELRFPKGEAIRRGISYTRRFERSKQYAMTPEEARSRGKLDRYEFGTSIAVQHPVRKLTVVVRFPQLLPEGHQPARMAHRA